MDLLDYKNHDLYFDAPLSIKDEILLQKAVETYPSKKAEETLQAMHIRLPESLIIIITLYRFYYNQNYYQEALKLLGESLEVSATKLGLPSDWVDLTEDHLGMAVFVSMGMVRFYMLTLKTSAHLLMRTGEIEQAYYRLEKIVELDHADHFGATFLLEIAEKELEILLINCE